ncbi:hypothetical protein SLE2022_206380 [Rubroshorea leprosula]
MGLKFHELVIHVTYFRMLETGSLDGSIRDVSVIVWRPDFHLRGPKFGDSGPLRTLEPINTERKGPTIQLDYHMESQLKFSSMLPEFLP